MRILVLPLALVACSGSSDSGGGPDGTSDGGPTLVPGTTCIPPDRFAPITPAVPYETIRFEDWPVIQYIPDNPIGLIYYFHGSGGDAHQVLQLETMGEMNVFVESGFGLVATESELRGSGALWSDEPSWDQNPDYQRLDAIREDLIAQGAVDDDTPIFTMGFSNGGFYAGSFATAAQEQGWPVAAASAHNAVPWDVADGLPLFLVEAENDEAINVPAAEDVYDERHGQGWPTEYRLASELVLDPLRFTRIPDFTEEMSQNAFTELGVFGLIDDQGVRGIDLEDLEPELVRYQNEGNIPQAWEVVAQMRVVWATHRFDNQYVVDECHFFVDQLP